MRELQRLQEPAAWSREPLAGRRRQSREYGGGSRESGAGSRESGDGSREPGAGSQYSRYCRRLMKIAPGWGDCNTMHVAGGSVSFFQGHDLFFNLPHFHGFADFSQPAFYRLFPDMLYSHLQFLDVVFSVHGAFFGSCN